MAYAPLRTAPWGVAMGASEAEVLEPVANLRTRFVVIGGASLLTFFVGGIVALNLYRRDHERSRARRNRSIRPDAQ